MRLLDTDMCVALIRRRAPAALARLQELDPANVGVSSITVAELDFGVARSSMPDRNRDALTAFLAPLVIHPFDATAAFVYGALRRALEADGKPIGNLDTLIAAHALSRRWTLVTHNVREFRRVAGLSIEDWLAESS
jgi:tRNA(fMet)-specific endonuclease VapC